MVKEQDQPKVHKRRASQTVETQTSIENFSAFLAKPPIKEKVKPNQNKLAPAISSSLVRQANKENISKAQIVTKEDRKQKACERLYQRAMNKPQFQVLGWRERKAAMDYK